MSDPIPTGEPPVLVAGDSWAWRRSVPKYPASDGWTLKYRIVCLGTAYVFAAAAEGAGYLVTVTAENTGNAAQIAAGVARWYAWVEKSSPTAERHTVDEGTVEILADPATVKLADSRSHAERMLALIEAELERRLNPADPRERGVRGYSIGDRSIQFAAMTEDELSQRRGYYVRIVERERHPHRGMRTVQAVFTTPGYPSTGRFP